jgi:hypothetical protein
MVTATRSAGTARFTSTSSNASTNRLLRGSTRGSGEVNFAHGAMRTVERERSVELSGTSAATAKPVAQDSVMDNVWIGRTEYFRFEADNDPAAPWVKGATWPRNSFGPLGALQEVGPLGALSLDEGVPGLRIEDAGSATVHGVETSEYRIVVPTCGTATPLHGISESTGPLELWVDGHDRLVQARQTTTEDITKDAQVGDALAGESFPTGRATSISTVDLRDFGAPASIAAPPVVDTQASGGSGFITAVRGRCP